MFATSAKKRRFSLLFRTYKGRKFAFALEAAPRKIIYHHESLTQFRGKKIPFLFFLSGKMLYVSLSGPSSYFPPTEVLFFLSFDLVVRSI